MARPISSSRGLDGQFEELRDHSIAWVGELRRVAEGRIPNDSVVNAQANLEITREFFGKWSLEILVILSSRPAVGFEELRRLLRGITPRVLSGRLKALEARHLIVRRVVDDRPPRVQYRLSPDGVTLVRLGEPVFLFLRLHTKVQR